MSINGDLELQSQIQKSSIADEIWGPSPDSDGGQARLETLSSFFGCYRKEKDFERV